MVRLIRVTLTGSGKPGDIIRKGKKMFNKPVEGSWLFCIATFVAVSSSLVWDEVAHAEQPYEFEWAAQVGTSTNDRSHAVTVDVAGNSYISGYTFGDLYEPNAGRNDAFLTKFDPSGNELWGLQVGTADDDLSYSVAVDVIGNVYMFGYTGDVDVDYDAFLTKFDASGTELWSRSISTPVRDLGYSVAVDGDGNAFISGITFGSLGGANLGGADAFLAKYNASGTELWSRQIGTTSDDASLSVAVDGAGNAFISGTTDGSLGGPNAGSGDAYLTKLDASGTELWSRQVGTTGDEAANAVAVDGAGNAYMSYFGAIIEPAGGAVIGFDDFLTKFDASGNELWSQQITLPAGYDVDVEDITVDDAGNVYITGLATGPAPQDNGAVLLKYDPAGNKLWQSESAGAGVGVSVALDGVGNAYISGHTYSGGVVGGPNAGGNDAFLVKFTVPEPATLTLLAFSGMVLLRRDAKA